MDTSQEKRRASRNLGPIVPRLLRALSFATTPLLVLVSPALALFLKNQRDLDYAPSVVVPFVLLAAVVWCLGIWLGSFRSRIREILVWAYYLAGPLYVIHLNVTLLTGDDSALPILPILLAIAVGLLAILRTYDVSTDHGTQLLAVMGLLLIGYEAFRFMTAYDQADSPRGPNSSSGTSVPEHEFSTAPNVYHLLFDGYQGDVFTQRLTEEHRLRLGGFVHFPATTAVFNQTVVSLPGTFSGVDYDFLTPLEDYQYAAFNSDVSFLSDLKRAGYHTAAYTRKFYAFELGLFDEVIQHIHNSIDSRSGDVIRDFAELWVYATLPTRVSSWMLSEEDLESFERNVFLPYSAPIRSAVSMRRIIAAEENRASTGRYTFIHLMFPHLPHVLGADCTYDSVASNASPEEAYACAMKTLEDFLQRLEDLGRYEDSMIVVQGDHGSYLRLEDGQLHKAPSRSPSTVLLVKPFGQSRETPMSTSTLPITTTDIAWLMRRAINQPNGSWRDDLQQAIAGRQRYFYVAAKRNSFSRYAIEDNLPVAAGSLKYNNTPRGESSTSATEQNFPVNAVVEAEDGGLSGAVDIRSDQPGTSGMYVMSGNKSFKFKVDEPGVYALRARVISPSGNNDSSYVTAAKKRSTWVFRIKQEWTWFEYRRSWQLDPGEHSVLLSYREPIFLDQVQLALKTVMPDVVVEAEAGHLDGSVVIIDEQPGRSHQYLTGGRTEFTFMLVSNAVYRLRARVRTTEPDVVCDLWLEKGGTHSWSIGNAPDWTWVTSEVDWKTEGGPQRLRITPHAGLLIDQIELVTVVGPPQ